MCDSTRSAATSPRAGNCFLSACTRFVPRCISLIRLLAARLPLEPSTHSTTNTDFENIACLFFFHWNTRTEVILRLKKGSCAVRAHLMLIRQEKT